MRKDKAGFGNTVPGGERSADIPVRVFQTAFIAYRPTWSGTVSVPHAKAARTGFPGRSTHKLPLPAPATAVRASLIVDRRDRNPEPRGCPGLFGFLVYQRGPAQGRAFLL